MKIQELYINNFKSLVDFKLVNPNSFSVFVGPNGAGKSNVFEALEYVNCTNKFSLDTLDKMFEGASDFLNNNCLCNIDEICSLKFNIKFLGIDQYLTVENTYSSGLNKQDKYWNYASSTNSPFSEFHTTFSRIFIKIGRKRLNTEDNVWLSANADNLEKVLKRILQDQTKREEILDWLRLFVPELENIEVHSDNIGGTETLLVREKNIEKPLRKNLISDGTYNILALLTAIYQSDEPQFLCIEEPENGLNPYVVKELVSLCREACEKMGHTIWLNTHSPTLVAELKPEELILIDKKDGITRAKQFTQEEKLFGLSMDEAWLSNALGGGLPW